MTEVESSIDRLENLIRSLVNEYTAEKTANTKTATLLNSMSDRLQAILPQEPQKDEENNNTEIDHASTISLD